MDKKPPKVPRQITSESDTTDRLFCLLDVGTLLLTRGSSIPLLPKGLTKMNTKTSNPKIKRILRVTGETVNSREW